MNDRQKQTVNHVYHFLKDLLYKYEIGFYQCNGRKPDDTDLKSMIWYLETNFPEDMLKHEMENEDAISGVLESERRKWEFRYNNQDKRLKELDATVKELRKKNRALRKELKNE